MAATVKNIKRVPAVVPGAGMTEVTRRGEHWIKSDAVAYGDTSPVLLMEVPGNVLITDAYVRVKTAFDASGTSAAATAVLTVPNDTGAETIFDSNLLALQATGFHRATGGALTPDSGGYIQLTYTAGTTTAGALEVYVAYVDLADRL